MPPKFSVKRPEDLNRIPRQIKAKDALVMLQDAGWELVRERGGHRIVKRRDLTLTLPSTGNCSPWLSQQVARASASGAVVSRSDLEIIPLMVMYRDKPYAVQDKRGPNYVLTDLDTGERVTGMVLECRAVTEDDLEPRQVAAPEPPVAEPAPEPEPAIPEPEQAPPPPEPSPEPEPPVEEPVNRPQPTNAQLEWVNYTRDIIRGLDEKIEALFAEVEALEEQKAVFERAIAMVVGEPGDPPEPELKRTILPPTGPGSQRERADPYPWTQEEEDQIIIQSKKGRGPAEIARNLRLTRQLVNNKINRLRQQGKL